MNTPNTLDFAAENAALRTRLEEAEKTLRAIRAGQVIAPVVGEDVYTFKGAETPYRLLIESMNEGAATLAPDGTILYCNRRFAEMVATPAGQVIGSSLWQWVASAQEPIARSLVATARHAGARAELTLRAPAGPGLSVLLSLRPIELDSHTIGVVAADLSEHKRAEEALRESEARAKVAAAVQVERQRLQNVLNMLPAYVVLLSPDYHVPMANRFFEQRFGKSEGRRCYEYLFNRTEPCEVCETYKVLKTNSPLHWEWTGPDGRNYDIHDFPFTDVDGSPLIMEVGMDITERKQAETALAVSEKEFRLLAEAMPQIVWATRADGWNSYFNQQWVDYTGLTLEESCGHGWNKPFHPDDQQRAWDAWQNAVTNRATYALECRLRQADGAYRWWLVRGVPVLDEKGRVLKWFGTCTDINDLKEAEKALREAGEERLRLVLEATSMGTFEVDLRTGEGRWNTVEFELLGLKPGDAPSLPATFFRYLHPDDAARVQAQWAQATQTGILNTEFRIVRADGEVRWLAGLGRFAYAGKPDLSAPEGKPEPERFLGVNFDITERKQMEEVIRRRAEELRASNEELTHFNEAMVGRELRMIELKQEIDALCAKFGQPPRYAAVPGEDAPPAQ